MHTLELSSRYAGIKYRMFRFDDLDVILHGFFIAGNPVRDVSDQVQHLLATHLVFYSSS
jgi:hypothetical protein